MTSIPDDPLPSRAWWFSEYQSVQPTGWALRGAFRDRWLRIHSLTNSKRYPVNVEDWSELRKRHRYATSLLLTEGEQGFLISPWVCAGHDVFPVFGLKPSHWLPEFQADDDEAPSGPFHAAKVPWSFDSFIPILEAVAEDATCALFVTEDASRIYAPYDGGADLFSTESKQLTAMRSALRDFLSPRSDGL